MTLFFASDFGHADAYVGIVGAVIGSARSALGLCVGDPVTRLR